MNIPADAVIPIEKLTTYLLSPRLEDDKSKFLATAGFSLQNYDVLENAIHDLAESESAYFDGANEFGDFFRVDGTLEGPIRSLQVSLIWIQLYEDTLFHFVTLKPCKH
jgi:hypothetical protein